MLVLLPPSEGKTPPAAGGPADPKTLLHPDLNDARVKVAAALASASAKRTAAALLGLGPANAAEAQWNAEIWTAPAASAAEVYTGVLYAAAGMPTWTASQLHLAANRIRIVSGLWGLLSPADRIPAYRLPIRATLPRIGPLAAFWRPRIGPILDELAGDALVVDCRSGGYTAAWPGRGRNLASVRVVSDVGGTRKVVSHWAKHARGLLVGALVAADAVVTSGDDLADFARGALAGHIATAEWEPATTGGTLTLVTAP